MPNYTLQYPPVQNGTYVKATTSLATYGLPYFATDPAISLIGTEDYQAWMTAANVVTNQRFHIDLGAAKIIRRIYYENLHHNGTLTNQGVKNFTFWGSNTGAAFADLTFATDTNWTQLTTAQSTFDIHASANSADPKYILVTNNASYRYYAIKCADNYGATDYMAIRRIVLMTEDGYPSGAILAWFFNPCWAIHDKLWRNNKLILPKDLGFSY